MSKQARSRGAFELAKTGLNQDEIADRVGMPRQQIGYYLAGKRTPQNGNREKFESAFGIAPDLWEEPLQRPPRDYTQPLPRLERVDSASIQNAASDLKRELDRMLDELRSDPGLTLHVRGKIIALASQTLANLGRLTGESLELSESKVLKLPHLRRIQDALREAIKPWPEAARAIGKALEKLNDGG